jgi:hypothetical protein
MRETRAEVELRAEYIKFYEAVKVELVRVRVRIEEIE